MLLNRSTSLQGSSNLNTANSRRHARRPLRVHAISGDAFPKSDECITSRRQLLSGAAGAYLGTSIILPGLSPQAAIAGPSGGIPTAELSDGLNISRVGGLLLVHQGGVSFWIVWPCIGPVHHRQVLVKEFWNFSTSFAGMIVPQGHKARPY